MASSDSFLLAPGESLRSSQVMSPSAQGGLATVASVPVQNGIANAVTQDALRAAPEVPHQGDAQLSGTRGDLLRADVYDPTMRVSGASAVFQCMAPPDMAEPAREPQMERDEASSHTAAAATAQALAIASTIPQQQTTDQGYYATSPMASRISSRTAEQMPAGGASHPMVRWVSRLTEFLRTSTSRGVGGYEAMATTGFLQEEPSELAMTPARFAGAGAAPLSRTGTPAQATCGHKAMVPRVNLCFPENKLDGLRNYKLKLLFSFLDRWHKLLQWLHLRLMRRQRILRW